MSSPSRQPVLITTSAFQEAQEENLGFCTECRRFTTEFCKPDAYEYTCDECDEDTVYGADEALLLGLLEVD